MRFCRWPWCEGLLWSSGLIKVEVLGFCRTATKSKDLDPSKRLASPRTSSNNVKGAVFGWF